MDLYCVACEFGLSTKIRPSGDVKFQMGMQALGQVYASNWHPYAYEGSHMPYHRRLSIRPCSLLSIL